jgi:RNA polymerase sigma factor (sigma-70 family)
MTPSGRSWYRTTISRVPLLTPAEEIELGTAVRRWLDHDDGPDDAPHAIRRRGIRARDRFVHANLKLSYSYVTNHCRRLTRRSDWDDVIQSANLGLLRAVEKFDPTRGFRFSTYAYWWIRQAVGRFADCNSGPIHRPAVHSRMLGSISVAAQQLQQEIGSAPTLAQLADVTGITAERIRDLLNAERSCISLDQLLGDDDDDLSFDLASVLAAAPPAAEHDSPERLWLLEQLEELPAEDQQLLDMIYGLHGEPLPLAEAAQLLGFQTSRGVRARERQIIALLTASRNKDQISGSQ